METQIASAAAATVISVAFSLALFDRWLQHRRRHVLSWLVSMVFFAGASAALWAGASFGWTEASFKLFFLLGAVLSVPPLGLGTIYLLAGPRRGDRLAVPLVVLGIFSVGVLTATAADTSLLGSSGIPQGSDVFAALPRALAAIGSIGGSLAVLGGAIFSLLNLSPSKAKLRKLAEAMGKSDSGSDADADSADPDSADPAPQPLSLRPERKRVAGGTGLVALGTILLGTGGLLNSVADEMTAFALSLAIGAALLFTGFMVSTTKPAAKSKSKSAAAAPLPQSSP